MANNVGSGLNAGKAKQDISLADAGLTNGADVNIVYGTQPLQSYKPGRSINSLTTITKGRGLLLNMKAAKDYTAWMLEPDDDVVTPTLIWEDTFNAADDTDINGRSVTTGSYAWERFGGETGTIGIVSNQAVWINGTAAHYYVNVSNGRNVDARFTMGTDPTPDTYPFSYGVLAFVDPDNCYLFELVTGKIYKRLGGTQTTVYNGSGTSVPGDVMRSVMKGTDLKIYRNATLLTTLTINATDVPGTAYGLWSTATNESGINAVAVYTAP